MEFGKFKRLYAVWFKKVTERYTLFETDADKDKLWEIYLASFPAGTNPIYRKRTEYDCSVCRHFIKDIGTAVYFDENLKMHSVFETDIEDEVFKPVFDALASYVETCNVTGIFLSERLVIGQEISIDYLDRSNKNTVVKFEHFCVPLPRDTVFDSRISHSTIDTAQGAFRDRRNVFKRSLDEISLEAMETVNELISSNTLYKGEEWKSVIGDLIVRKTMYDSFTPKEKEAYCWVAAKTVGDVLGKIRNHSIGALLTDISEGIDLDEAVRRYEAIVAPANYKRPKVIYTKKMLEEAQKTVEEMGYMDSLPRRYATLDDIKVSDILFANRDASKRISGNVFDDMARDVKTDPKKFSRAEEIGIEKFIADVIPTASSIEALVENRHKSNLVSLIAPVNRNAKSMFKWNNGFSWAYAGNMTDSDIRENVKKAGGRVDGVLRFSIQWNDEKLDKNDLDAYCILPTDDTIFFMQKRNYGTHGSLDVDIINPEFGKPAVENIVFPEKRFMPSGTYKFFVNCYTNRGGTTGFRAEIEIDGQIYSYDYRKELRQGENVPVADVTLHADGSFTINEKLPSTTASCEVWGIKTMIFTPVTVIMNSPNYWDGHGVGHKHYFFMLNGCMNPEKPNGFYNEFLKQELIEHKRVFEALGSRMAVETVPDQLSGIGFSSTKRNELIVKVKSNSNTERVFKIKF